MFTIPLIICVRPVTNAVKKCFASGGLSSLLNFYLIQFQFLNLSLYIFKAIYYVHDYMNYFCATLSNAVKKFHLRRAFGASVFFNFKQFSAPEIYLCLDPWSEL